MKTLALRNDDIYFENGELAMIKDIDEVDQNTYILMNINKGEWFLNEEEGLDYDLLYDKMASEEQKREEVYNRLMSDSRIDSVESINFHYNRDTRMLEIQFKAITTEGEPIESVVNMNA